jgi:general secretion pathway protein K
MIMGDSSGTPARTAHDGFIIVAVLWILSALAVLVSIYAIYIANTAMALAVNDDSLQAEGLVSAGVELAAYRVIAARKETRPSYGGFTFRMGRANVAVGFRSEAARIDLNAAPKPLLAGLFRVLGAQPDGAERYADRIIGWRTAPASESRDSEGSLYGTAGLNYRPRGAPFAHVGELWLVLGLPPALIERAMPHLTVFSGRAEINPLVASPEVIAALPGMSPDRLSTVLAQRTAVSPDGQSALGTPDAAQAGTTMDGGNAMRVTVRVDLDNGRQMVSEVVILVRGGGAEPYRVLSWRNDVDELLPRQQPSARLQR